MQNTANVTERTTDWHSIDWRKANRLVRGLRRRIFKATSEGNWRKVRSLQKLMLRSYSNTLLNQSWKPKPVKRVYIPKSNGKKRPLGIPCIKDRCLQAMVKNALEPCWEAQFEGTSYGFRPGRSTHDAIGKIYCAVRPNHKKKWVLDADIRGCFDNINQKKLMEIMGNFPGRKLIKLWLKAGYVDNNVYHKQETGTPQGGIISPLLANIALHGMEEALGIKYNPKGKSIGKRILVRYADDFVCMCETKEDAIKAQEEIDNWLRGRGLELSPEKTKIVHLTEGFDFLGFNIRHYKVKNTKTGYKLLIKPSREFLKQTRKEIREIFLNHKGKPVVTLINALNPVIRGKANYMNKVVSSAEFIKLDYYLYKRQERYVKRTHPQKGKKWTKKRYWGSLNLSRKDKWVFGDKNTGAYMLKFSWFKIERHALVKKRYSPDDPELREYWENRGKKRDQSKAKRLNKIQEKVAHKQGYKCPVCGESLFNDEPLHLHHIIARCKGGKDEVKNLVWLHQYCHHKTHYQKK